jgi:hypothetical protein
MILTSEDHAAIADLVVAKLGAIRRPSPVLTRTEAIAHVGKKSDSAFDAWCQKMSVTACAGRGRYSRARLDRALDLESRGHRRKAA